MPITSYDLWDPRTWTAGEDVTASMMNTIKTHLNALRNQHFGTEGFHGVVLRTDPASPSTKVVLERFDEIVMNDGTRHNNWTAPLYADITVSGVGGLDTGAEASSNWYEVHLIAKEDGTKALILKLAPSYYPDATNASASTGAALRDASGNTRIGQSFQPGSSSFYLTHVDIPLTRTGSPSGSVSVELADSGRTVLATSYPVTIDAVPTGGTYQTIRFVFPLPVLVTAATTYHLQITGTFSISGANYISVQSNASDVYANGQRYTYDGATWTGTTGDLVFATYLQRPAAAPSYPSGYTKHCRIGFVYNNSGSNFTPFRALDREVRHGGLALFTGGTATVPTLTAVPYAPPVPVLLYPAFSASVASDVFRIGGVPDGYDLTFGTVGNTSSTQIATTGTSDIQDCMSPILVDRQGLYYQRLSGSGNLNLYSYGYRW